GHALGASEDLAPKRARQPGYETGKEILHRLRRQPLQRQRRAASTARAPGRAPLEELRPRQRDHIEGVIAGPVEQVFDEVEQGAVRPLHVLEGEHGRVLVGETLEEEAPRSEQVLPVARLVVAEPEQLREAGLDIPSLLRVEDVLVERRAQLS